MQVLFRLAVAAAVVAWQMREDGAEVRSAFAQREQRRMVEREKVEEDLFLRIPLSKAEKKRQKGVSRQVGALAQLGDLGDEVADLVQNADSLSAAGLKKGRLEDLGGRTTLPSRGPAMTGDEDLPTRQSLSEKRAAFGRKAHALATMQAMHDADNDDDHDARPAVRTCTTTTAVAVLKEACH